MPFLFAIKAVFIDIGSAMLAVRLKPKITKVILKNNFIIGSLSDFKIVALYPNFGSKLRDSL
jgi:hypothetical protein